jgi:hypothetical protein
VVFDYPRTLAIQTLGDSRVRYGLALDITTRSMILSKREDPFVKYDFSYQEPEADVLVLEGTLEGQRIHAKLHRTEPRSFLLTDRGFHWINEYPFNR